MKAPFATKSRTVRTTLKGRTATLTREVQTGTLPLGGRYTKASWWVTFSGSPCAMGPFSKNQVRTAFAA